MHWKEDSFSWASPSSWVCHSIAGEYEQITSLPPHLSFLNKMRMMTKVKLQKTDWQFLKKFNLELLYDIASLLLCLCPRELKIQFMSTQKFAREYSQQHYHISVKMCQQLKCQTWIKYGQHLTVKGKEVLTYATTQVNFKI